MSSQAGVSSLDGTLIFQVGFCTPLWTMTEVTINLSSNVVGYSNDETNFPHKCLITYASFKNS